MSDKLPRVDCQQLIRALKRAGFEEQRRASDNKRVTVPVHRGRTMPLSTLRAILRDADISLDEFRDLL